MISLVRGGGPTPLKVLALALGVWVFTSAPTVAQGDGFERPSRRGAKGPCGHGAMGIGTVGYGGHGLYPGFQGFGLSYHPGYGYGGCALGVGADGGYPDYGGPGYPHGEPRLQRFCGIAPFSYHGGPEYRGYGPTNGYGPGDPNEGGFGPYTGPAPYPETFFAAHIAAAAATGSATGGPSHDPFRIAPTTAPDAGAGPSASMPPAMGETADRSMGQARSSLIPKPASRMSARAQKD